MSKPKTDIWMPIYIGDYLADTARLDATSSGCYLHWLMDYWRNGPLPNEIPTLCTIGKLNASSNASSNAPSTPASIAQALLDQYFTLEQDNCWHQKRMDYELAAWNAKKLKAKEKAKKAADAKWGKDAPSNAPSITQAMLGRCPLPSPLPKDLNTLVEIDEAPTPEPIPEDKSEHGEAVEHVFQYYVEKLKRDTSRYTLTPKRMNKGLVCLKHCLKLERGELSKAVDKMCDAVDGLTRNDWLMGRDPRSRTSYIEWEEHIFKDVETMEKRWNDFHRKAN